jgi:spore coat protein A
MAVTQLNFVVRAAALLTAAAFAIQCSSDSNGTPSGGGGGAGGGADGGKDSSVGPGGDATTGSDGTVDAGGGITKPVVQAVLEGANIPKYVEPLPTFDGKRVGAAAITVDMVEFQEKILPASIYADVPDPYKAGTYLWGYNVNGSGPRWPANTIEAQRMTPTVVTYTNHLQGQNGAPPVLQKWLVTDLSLHWSDPLHITHDPNNNCMSGPPLAAGCLNSYGGPVPATVHLHGAEVLSDFDGQPDTWFTPGLALKGPAFVNNVYTYPNGQEAATLWFHDHSLGTTRLNVFAGLAGFYLIRDNRDTGLANNPLGLPAGPFETELLIADRQFDTNGQLFFPNGAPGNRFGINGPPPNPDTHPYWNPEFFGDVITVNGKSWPFMEVQPRRYRFRIVNSSNARMYRMRLVGSPVPDGGVPEGGAGDGGGGPPEATPSIWQIGSDGGFLDTPVQLNNPGDDPEDPASALLFLAPAERADVIVDFGLPGLAGKAFTLVNDAVAPFPSGDPPDPNTAGQIMEFRIGQSLPDGGVDTSFNPASSTDAGAQTLRAAPMVDFRPIAARPANKTRQLVLVEVEGFGGPLEVLVNNSHWNGAREGSSTQIPGSTSNGAGITATETPQIGSTEVWEIANLTEDAHPIHIHLIQFQVMDRQALAVGNDVDATPLYRAAWDGAFPGGTFNGTTYASGEFIPGFGPPLDYATPNADGALGGNVAFGNNADAGPSYFDGPPTPPAPNELGWKDTLRMLPKTVTRIAVRFAPQGAALSAATAGTNLFSFDPTAKGPGYTWHCHILDHEDNEMMRPYLVSK